MKVEVLHIIYFSRSISSRSVVDYQSGHEQLSMGKLIGIFQ